MAPGSSPAGSRECPSQTGVRNDGKRKYADPESAETEVEEKPMKKAIQSAMRGLSWAWGHKVRTVVLLVVFTLLAPKPIRSQLVDPCCAILTARLTTISNTLGSAIRPRLN